MGLFDFIKPRRLKIDKTYSNIFEEKIPLRIIKGKIIGHSIKTLTRYYDKHENILRYGDGMDEQIVKHENYSSLELYVKIEYVDGFNKLDDVSKEATIYFESNKLFNDFHQGDTIIYYGFYLTVGSIWTNYCLHNLSNGKFKTLYFINTINKSLFKNEKSLSELEIELDKGIIELTKNTSSVQVT